jgi:hypothetical protein
MKNQKPAATTPARPITMNITRQSKASISPVRIGGAIVGPM